MGTSLFHRQSVIDELIILFDRTLIFTNEPEDDKLPDSQNESSDREVSPKFVVGAKKYGRRSRPQFIGSDSSPSESDDPDRETVNSSNSIVQRSSSQSDILSSHRRRPLSGGAKLKRCASLPAQKNQRVRDAILEKTKAARASKAANKLNNTSSVESLGNLDFENLTNKILDIWKEYGSEIGTYYFTCDQLQIVCERVGLVSTIAEKVAEEVFEKLNKIKTEPVITFSEFISLISCGDNNTFAPAKLSSTSPLPPPPQQQTWQFNNLFEFVGHKTPFNKTSSSVESNNSIRFSHAVNDDKQFNMKDIPAQLDTVPTHSIIEMWERANITSPKGLLLSLGFDEDEVNVLQLSKVLEEELRGLCGEAQTTLLKASLALQSAELSTLKQSYIQLSEENKKMHADNKDANRRVIMLAQEIDERHANLEDTTKKEIRLLEQRHAEVVRDLTARMANDRENWSNLTARLEARIKMLEQEETKLKTETESLRKENNALENEQTVLQKQVTSLLEANIQLNKEIVESEERSRNDEGSKNEKDTEEMLELIEKITSLQVENANLRDKNDELVAEVEGLNFEISRAKTKRSQKATVASSTEEDPEHASAAIKRRGDSPSKTRITEESPRLGKFRRCNTDANSESDTSGDWVALNSELNNPLNVTSTPSTSSGFSQDSTISTLEAKDQEITSLKAKISQLESELKCSSTTPSSTNTADSSVDISTLSKEKEALEVRCKELEASLEQMQKAYEDCEDYWQEKLSEERQLFDKERKIYEDEQKESDVKFTELVEKVREYEEQFSKDGRLSPIEEKDVLEQQYADLEAEAEQLRQNTREIFEEKAKEIASLHSEIEDLKIKLGESVEILTGATEMQSGGEMSDLESPASSPISYLWHQSTIQSPITQYKKNNLQKSPTTQRSRLNNLSTSETTVFSTTQSNSIVLGVPQTNEPKNISPIQKPNTPKVANIDATKDCEDSSSTASGKSFESQSVASTHSIQKSTGNASSTCSSPNIMKEELKRLKYFEIQLKDQIKDLSLKRDGLVMELQQLQEAKPVLEKAYARAAAHPTLIQRVNHLELKNRHLQNVIKQQHQYTESLLQQSWQQQHLELSELRNRIENQGMIMTEQTNRLANADVLVKELYVENSHLTATIQRLEQQMCRVNLIHQHQSLSGLPGMP
ncbi:blastoderm-specific protein 25D isoform X2 [Episyrphus balteatus]|uniref:blastoderm-specific protein 25D isoform X2 n=1 Tax=Episyrphus balteatus TaxID=286459 RepID=UPI00248651AE|nr:blastoderm-specific protein 25D isoform X2 [Episyrphus balteatus]XP_055856018.1 blastoderm-specific protein 25D isoform X2 [Episyrphus balteatus]XP_055856022.1 blastoderm-specific protein 25D isoform X2 [Episyrphus balteatus]XP_055856028.1 blastoderm-specific protein 25D isoform X2 [Episyrphus balteatus]